MPRHESEDLVSDVRASIDREIDALEIFGLPRSVALQSALVAFELVISQLLAMISLGKIDRDAYSDSVTQRVRIEDSLARLIPVIWTKCKDSGAYNTAIDRASILSALAALNSFVKIDLIEIELGATRFNETEFSTNDDTIEVRPVGSLTEWEYRFHERNRNVEWEWERAGLDGVETKRNLIRDRRAMLKAYLESEMRVHGFKPTTYLGDYSAGDFVEVWSSIEDLAGQIHLDNLDRIKVAWRGTSLEPRKFIIVIRQEELLGILKANCEAAESKVIPILTSMIYEGQQHETSVFLFPLVRVGSDFIAISPNMIWLIEPFRNLRQRLAITSSYRYSIVQRELSNTTVKDAAMILREFGYNVMPGKKIKDGKKRVLTDIDLVAAKQGVVLIIQMKNINPAETAQEYERVPGELVLAEKQLSLSIDYVKSHSLELFPGVELDDPKYFPLILTGVRLSFGTTRPNWLYLDVLEFQSVLKEINLGIDPMKRLAVAKPSRMIGRFSIGGQRYDVELGRPSGQDETAEIDYDPMITNVRHVIELSGLRFS